MHFVSRNEILKTRAMERGVDPGEDVGEQGVRLLGLSTTVTCPPLPLLGVAEKVMAASVQLLILLFGQRP